VSHAQCIHKADVTNKHKVKH